MKIGTAVSVVYVWHHKMKSYIAESWAKLFASRKASTVLNALKNKGVPAKDNGLTGPIVIKEYCFHREFYFPYMGLS